MIGQLRDPDIGRRDGERRKAEMLELLAAQRESLIRRGRRALLTKLLDTGEATADDVRAAVELPDGIRPVCFGAVPVELARAGIIRRDGFGVTARAAAHARPVSVWCLRDRAAALAWLARHPDLPDPPPKKNDPAGATAGPEMGCSL